MGGPWEKYQKAPVKGPWEKYAAQPAPQTNIVEQTGAGMSEGVANMAGLPVDALTGAINWAGGKFGMSPIEKPFGGSESIKGALDPFISDTQPQTAGQRIGRRVGQDVGAGAVAGPVMGATSLAGLGLNTAADAASGLAGGATSEVTDNPTINMIASLLAGGGTVAGAHALRPGPRANVPSVGQLKDRAGELYDQVRESDFRLPPDDVQRLQGDVSARMHDEGMYPPTDTAAKGGVDRVYELSDRTPTGAASLQDLEDARRYVSRKVVPSQVPGEDRLGRAIKGEIDKTIDKVAGAGHPDAVALREARSVSRRYLASEDLSKTFDRAELRADSTGLGGNDINAIRQNIRGILDSDKRSSGFTAPERAEMRTIVKGTDATNAFRFFGGLAPQRGLGGAGLAVAQGVAAGATGNLLYATPGAVGMVAQAIGEHLTKRQVRNLSEMIRNGGPVAAKGLSDSEKAVIAALTAIQASQQGQQ